MGVTPNWCLIRVWYVTNQRFSTNTSLHLRTLMCCIEWLWVIPGTPNHPIFRPNRLTELKCFHPSICTSATSTKRFSDFNIIWRVSRPRPDMCTSVTSTRSKVKVTELLSCRKLHFSRSVSSAILSWSSKLTVGNDSTGPDLQLFGARFSNFLVRKLSREFNLCGCRYYTNFKASYFRGYSHTVGHAGSPTCIVHADMTLTRSKVKVKVKVTKLLDLQKLHFSRSICSAILAWSSKLTVANDSMGPGLQLVAARFSHFLLRKLSCEFRLRWMSILHEFQRAIFTYCLRIE